MESSTIHVRAAGADDLDFLCEFLHQYMDPSISSKGFRALFMYPWMPEKPDYGFVLTDAGRIVGFIGTIYADRDVDGRKFRFCNLSCWFVLPEYRNYSLQLLQAVHRQRSLVFTNLTARPAVEKVSLALRYQVLNLYKLFTVPFAHAAGLFRRPAPRILLDRGEIATSLDGPFRKLFDDHARTGCGHLLLQAGSEGCYVIWKRRVKQSVPFSEILYASHTELLQRHFERVKLRILLHDRTFLLAIDENLLGRRFHFMYPYRRITLFRSNQVGKAAIDSLYSELTLF